MAADLVDAFPAARQTFEEADDALGFELSRLCREGPESELTLTSNAQPAILTHSIAVWRVLSETRPLEPAMAAGHSLGEFSAHVAAGTLTFADAVRLVRRRGELMLASGERRPGSMAAILGLEDGVVESVCETASRESGGTVVPANFNSPGQVVISGDVDAVTRAAEVAREAGARRALPLNVSGAFHSPLMESAVPGFQEALGTITARDPSFPVVSNVTAEPVDRAVDAHDLLVRQLTAPVRWVASIRRMIDAGVTDFVEIGPGSVLAGLLRRIEKGATGRTLGTVAEVNAFTGEN